MKDTKKSWKINYKRHPLILYLIDGKEVLDVVSGKVDATKFAGSITLSCVLAFVAFILQSCKHYI